MPDRKHVPCQNLNALLLWKRVLRGGRVSVGEMVKALPDRFYEYGEAVLAGSPEVAHTWSRADNRCVLSIPSSSPRGFDIELDVERKMVTVAWGQWHTHFELEPDLDEFVTNVFGLLRDMLSPDMRIRELCASGSPYRGFLESFDGEKWSTEAEMGLLIWNYFGKRSSRTYSNTLMSPRLRDSVPNSE